MSDNYGDKPFDFSQTKLSIEKFPFRTALSLSPLVDFWNQVSSSNQPIKAACAKELLKALKEVPELLEPITDLSVIEQNRGVIDMLMTVVFPPAFWEEDYSAAFPLLITNLSTPRPLLNNC